FALYPLCVQWVEEFNKQYPNIQVDISAGGAGKGMADALSGMVDLGMFSREVSQAEVEKGAWFIAVARDAVLPTMNAAHPERQALQERGITRDEFRSIFMDGKITRWQQLGMESTEDIRIYTRSDACGAAAVWAEYLGGEQEDLLGLGVFGDPGLADAVKGDPLAIGYNNVNYVFDVTSRKKYDQLEVIPIDLNSDGAISKEEQVYSSLDNVTQAISQGVYPSPPARDLYLVSRGKPLRPQVRLFLEWILNKGQEMVSGAGYVGLTPDQVQAQRDKLQAE
ncbi:MAG TPA: substrate-binding domain-containing protein, partial [Bacteroidales bacterium]|nr:substrate-binding domain-containing protein [Bacteroidales bacterium]